MCKLDVDLELEVNEYFKTHLFNTYVSLIYEDEGYVVFYDINSGNLFYNKKE